MPGDKHTREKALYPAVTNWNIANEKRRKSTTTLPPFS
jgi:hypothetical protein